MNSISNHHDRHRSVSSLGYCEISAEIVVCIQSTVCVHRGNSTTELGDYIRLSELPPSRRPRTTTHPGPTEAGGPACQFAKLDYWPSPAGGASIRTATNLITYNLPTQADIDSLPRLWEIGLEASVAPTCSLLQATCGTLAEMCVT
jgi:hypothetical protein